MPMMWKDEQARSLYMDAKDRTIPPQGRINAVKELGTLACNGSDDAAWAISELMRHQESSFEVKREAGSQMIHVNETKRGRRRS